MIRDGYLSEILEGRNLSKKSVQQLELKLSATDEKDRFRLIGFYLSHSESEPSSCIPHIRWVIDSVCAKKRISMDFVAGLRFTSGKMYKELKDYWLTRMKVIDANEFTFSNAADFFLLNRDYDNAIESLECAHKCNPDDKSYLEELSRAYERAAKNGQARRWTEALRSCEEFTSDRKSIRTLSRLPKLAFAAEEFERAKQYSYELISLVPETLEEQDIYKYSMHIAHVVLGKIALSEGDMGTACEHLNNSVNLANSFTFMNAGPDMTLAEELLKFGEKEVVSEFVRTCSKYMLDARQKQKLALWIQAHNLT